MVIAHFSSNLSLNSTDIVSIRILISNRKISLFPLRLLKIHDFSKFLKVLLVAHMEMLWLSVPQSDAD